MDGLGRWMDNVFIERLWRSVKYEEIYLFERYNTQRPHEGLGNLTPAVVSQTGQQSQKKPKAA
jgi:putative transposase